MTATGADAAHEAAMQLGVLAVNLRARGFTAQVTRAGTRGCVGSRSTCAGSSKSDADCR